MTFQLFILARQWESGEWTKSWEKTQPGQLTPTDQGDILYQMTSCSVYKAGRRRRKGSDAQSGGHNGGHQGIPLPFQPSQDGRHQMQQASDVLNKLMWEGSSLRSQVHGTVSPSPQEDSSTVISIAFWHYFCEKSILRFYFPSSSCTFFPADLMSRSSSSVLWGDLVQSCFI